MFQCFVHRVFIVSRVLYLCILNRWRVVTPCSVGIGGRSTSHRRKATRGSINGGWYRLLTPVESIRNKTRKNSSPEFQNMPEHGIMCWPPGFLSSLLRSNRTHMVRGTQKLTCSCYTCRRTFFKFRREHATSVKALTKQRKPHTPLGVSRKVLLVPHLIQFVLISVLHDWDLRSAR